MLGFERKTPICITNCSSSMHVHESRVWVAGLKRRLSVSTFVAASKVTESDRSACCKLKDRGKFSRRVCFRVKPVQPHFTHTAETAFLSTYICSILSSTSVFTAHPHPRHVPPMHVVVVRLYHPNRFKLLSPQSHPCPPALTADRQVGAAAFLPPAEDVHPPETAAAAALPLLCVAGALPAMRRNSALHAS